MTDEDFKDAVRERVALIVAIAGASGTGKSFSALKLARGLAGWREGMTPEDLIEVDRKIAVIDTEARRALHYAPAPGELPGPDKIKFRHRDLTEPFTPERYTEAIARADSAGFEVIVIDSCSHEWEGDGGLHDIHEAILDEE